MKHRGEFCAALCVVGVAAGTDFATGRELSAFYGQMARASWLGTAVSGALFGFLTGMISHLARRAGADGVPELLRRMPGGRMGKGVAALYALVVALACCALVSASGRTGALVLPLRHAALYGACFAGILAVWIAVSGVRALRRMCAAFVGVVALFELGLMLFAKVPQTAALNYELELRLRDSIPAAVGLALLHASACACVAAGTTARLSVGRLRPAVLGLWSGALFELILLGGNAALMGQPEQLLALKLPFVALASGWGSAGFYLSAGMVYFAAVTTLAGLAYGLIPRNMMLNYEKNEFL